jgi:hypothetical protein
MERMPITRDELNDNSESVIMKIMHTDRIKELLLLNKKILS